MKIIEVTLDEYDSLHIGFLIARDSAEAQAIYNRLKEHDPANAFHIDIYDPDTEEAVIKQIREEGDKNEGLYSR